MKLTKKLASRLLEAAIFAEGKPMTAEKLRKVLPREQRPPLGEVRGLLEDMVKHYTNRGVQLVEVASGYRFQVAEDISEHLLEQTEEKPLRMSKAFMETLALTAYRQPITRGEIEDIRGVAVSSNIIRSLLELEWIREVGHKDVPGKPALFATTKKFLDFFSLKSLEDLPPLAQLQELSETRIKEEFEQLNLALETEMTDEERQKAQLIRHAQEATASPEFIGPRLPDIDHDDEVELDIEHEDDLELEIEHEIDIEAQDQVEIAAMAAISLQDEQESQDNIDTVAFEAEQNNEQPSLCVTDAHNAEPEWCEDLLVDAQDASENSREENSASIIASALKKMREDIELSKHETSSDHHIETQDIKNELSQEETELKIDQVAQNHRSLDNFSEIVITGPMPDKDDEANES